MTYDQRHISDCHERINDLTAKANARLCASCLESHPIDVMCPPHEARTTGPQWFRERLAARDAEIAEWKRIHQAREEQAVVDRTNIHCLTEERDRLVARIAELEQAIREHRDQKADDDDPESAQELCRALGITLAE